MLAENSKFSFSIALFSLIFTTNGFSIGQIWRDAFHLFSSTALPLDHIMPPLLACN